MDTTHGGAECCWFAKQPSDDNTTSEAQSAYDAYDGALMENAWHSFEGGHWVGGTCAPITAGGEVSL